MPCGTYTLSKIPDAKLAEAVAEINLDAPLSVKQTRQTDDSWTVVATYPPCPAGQSQTTNAQYGS